MQRDARLESLRHEIAAKHHVALGPDDPILILHTVNDVLIREAAAALQAAQARALAEYQPQLEQLAQRWSSNAVRISERALASAVEQSSALLERARIAAAENAREELERAGVEIIRRLQLVAGINLCASLIALAAAVGLWLLR
jgi:hypothetical protein